MFCIAKFKPNVGLIPAADGFFRKHFDPVVGNAAARFSKVDQKV